jgi:hypothetical protein
MDFTIFWIIGIVAFVALVAFGSVVARKYGLTNEDMRFAIRTLKLSLAFIDEMNLKNEAQIKQISQIVIDSLEFAIVTYEDPNQTMRNATSFAFDLCLNSNIKLTEERKELIGALIEVTFDAKYRNKLG